MSSQKESENTPVNQFASSEFEPTQPGNQSSDVSGNGSGDEPSDVSGDQSSDQSSNEFGNQSSDGPILPKDNENNDNEGNEADRIVPASKQTEQRIRNSFISILLDEKFNDITTKMIADRAGISRNTFYSYFDSKYDLFEIIENELIDGFLNIMLDLRKAGSEKYYADIKSGYNEYFVEYFKYIRQHFHVFNALIRSDFSTGFLTRFSRSIARVRLETIKSWDSPYSKKLEANPTLLIYREEILSSLYVSLFVTWIKRDMDLSIDKLQEMMVKLWTPIVDFID